MMREQTPEALAAIIEQAMEAESLRAAVETLTARVESADSHIELLESKNENIRTFWMGQWRLFRQQVVACLPFLKDGETPAVCIERWRNDGLALMKLLTDEKLRCEALDQEKAGLMSTLKGAGDATTEWMQRCEALEKELAEWKILGRDQETRAAAAEQRCEALEAVTAEAGVRYVKLESRCEALAQRLSEVEAERDKALRQRVTKREKREFDDLVGDATVSSEFLCYAPMEVAGLRQERDTLRSRCQHLEQAVKSLWQMTPCECRVDVRAGKRTRVVCESCEVYESALASLLPSQDGKATDAELEHFAAGYSTALDDALKGKRG